jgi:hypothetical protein
MSSSATAMTESALWYDGKPGRDSVLPSSSSGAGHGIPQGYRLPA